jgi:CDP-diacylglycerol---serine O-phosphatidyltransferase
MEGRVTSTRVTNETEAAGNRLKLLRREELRGRLYERRYVVPNAVTVGSMFCGFLTIIYAASGRFEKAAMAIGFAILLDGLDGRVARRLNATSKFGVEFDSFADLISFGVAPAALLYYWCFLPRADEFGVFVTFIYVICAASRLARFNITATSLKSFTGLPSPGAAGVIAAIVNFAPRVEPSGAILAFATVVTLYVAYLMVSNVEYFAIKQLKINTLQLGARVVLAAFIALIWYSNQLGLLLVAASYALSGPIMSVLGGFRPRIRERKRETSLLERETPKGEL